MRTITRYDDEIRLSAPVFEVGGSDATASTAFARIRGGVIDGSGRLWVSDVVLGQVFRLDTTGVVEVVGTKGRGPGEYVQPRVVGWQHGNVVIVDDEIGRITLLNPETDTAWTMRIEPAQWRGSPRFIAGLGSGGEYVFIPYFSGYRRTGEDFDPKQPAWVSLSPVMLAVQGPSDTGVVLFGEPIADNYFDGKHYTRDPASNAWSAGVYGDTVALVGALGGDVLVGHVAGATRLAFNMAVKPGEIVSLELIADIERYLGGLPEGARGRFAPLQALRDRGYPDVMPFFDRLVVSQDGLLWVRRKADTFGRDEVRWEVLSLDGVQVGTAVVSHDEEVIAVSGDRVATVALDPWGAPILRLYRHPFGR